MIFYVEWCWKSCVYMYFTKLCLLAIDCLGWRTKAIGNERVDGFEVWVFIDTIMVVEKLFVCRPYYAIDGRPRWKPTESNSKGNSRLSKGYINRDDDVMVELLVGIMYYCLRLFAWLRRIYSFLRGRKINPNNEIIGKFSSFSSYIPLFADSFDYFSSFSSSRAPPPCVSPVFAFCRVLPSARRFLICCWRDGRKFDVVGVKGWGGGSG